MSTEIVAWHFLVDLPRPYGRALTNCYVRAPKRQDAADLLLACHPQASFGIDRGSPLTGSQLEETLGVEASLLRGGGVSCIPL